MSALPFLIAFFLGYWLIDMIFAKDQKPDSLTHIFLSIGLGVGVCGELLFFHFFIFDRLVRPLAIMLPLILLVSLVIRQRSSLKGLRVDKTDLFCLAALLIVFIPIAIQGRYFQFGGWDAWSVWNIKARFFLLGGEQWKNMFDPALWRSSPHYPLLLPLINVWGWLFLKSPSNSVPILTALIFGLGMGGLLFSVLKTRMKNYWALLTVLTFLTLPFFVKLIVNQYSDIVLAYYLLAAFVCLILAKEKGQTPYTVLAGVFLGLAAFTKPEGMLAAFLITLLTLIYFSKRLPFLLGLGVASLAPLLFKILYAPENITFINGLFSSEQTVSLYRLKVIGMFFVLELVSKKWNGLWILLLAALCLSRGRCFASNVRMIPIFLLLYLLGAGFYYFINTYFEIGWWMQVTLNRVLFALLPTVVFWAFYSFQPSFRDA